MSATSKKNCWPSDKQARRGRKRVGRRETQTNMKVGSFPVNARQKKRKVGKAKRDGSGKKENGTLL